MNKRVAIWMAAVGTIAIALVALNHYRLQRSGASIEGAVLTQDVDVRKQLPIPDVEVTAAVGGIFVQSKSDDSGFFRMTLPGALWRRETAELRFRHPGYKSLNLTKRLSGQICVVRLTPVASEAAPEPSHPQGTLKDVRVRYAAKATTPINVGSTAKTFEVISTGDVACHGASPCSPDGKWKAAIGGLTLDAGEGHEFRSVRASCIAGPCPFARIESDQFSRGGRIIKVSVRNWSDTVTFLVEAEVIQTMLSDAIRNAYPTIFGREMSFTLPPTAQGPSIEADMNGEEIIYPLGRALTLPWAVCNLQMGADRTKLYRCELKPGYRFQ
jgi:hypothetical protein